MKNQRGGFALGLIVGLLLGLAVALGVALYVTKTPVPLMNKGQSHTPEQDAAENERNKTWDPNAALAGKQPARPATPAAPSAPATAAADTAPAPAAPRTPAPVLPTVADNGKVTPQSALGTGGATPAANAQSQRVEPVKSSRDAAAILNGQISADDGSEGKTAAITGTDPFVYFVQVGAYSRPEDAEQQRAKLALAGFRATITDREQNGRTVHRVRLGPFDKKDDADAQTERAKAIDPEASLVRVERSKQ
jgi:cell division protein FtsN